MPYLLSHLLTESAEKYPYKSAVKFRDENLSYSELNLFSNRLANALLEAGVREGDRVGIYMDKSIASIVSIFGILKTGAVYVPIDPSSPAKRLAYILDNCTVKCLLSTSGKISRISEIEQDNTCLSTLILMDDGELDPGYRSSLNVILWRRIVNSDKDFPPENNRNDMDLAYILYTSGSTGDPKGVMISHLNSLTFINWAHECFGIRSEDRLSNHAPIHFDLSIFDIFVAIKAGATIVLIPDEAAKFPACLVELIAEKKITVWYSVPSALMMLLSHGDLDGHDLSELRIVLFAGEVFPIRQLRMLMSSIPTPEYYNLYGPTETNVCTYYKVPNPLDGECQAIPIGKACKNMGVFVLDDGVKAGNGNDKEGELYVRGSGVAQGYWNDTQKTKSVFITNPLQHDFQETIYKTGDRVMQDAEGNWHFLGRKDQMVKVGGYRIELGEIESVIHSNSKIREVAVIAVSDDMTGNRIKAYITAENNDNTLLSDIKSHCSKFLPKYMIPDEIVIKSGLPKTSTGKIDKKALKLS